MIDKSSLTGQITFLLVWSLPLPTLILLTAGDHVTSFFGYILLLIIPIIASCILFGKMKTGEGLDFRILRIIIVSIIWGCAWNQLAFDFNHDLQSVLVKITDFSHLPEALVISFYAALVISIAVVVSYVLGKWSNKLIKK